VTATDPRTGEPTANPKAVLMLTIDFETLSAQFGAARVLGTLGDGTLLGCDTVRKLACDAGIIPVVLGGAGEILDVGREQRLFSKGQVRALWLRDGHCSFPGCDAPAAWCDAHHLVHWIDGGLTDLGNAALLCGRHHTIVHRDRLAGTVTEQGVVWDLRPGSYRPPDPPPTWLGGKSSGPDRPSPLRPSGRGDLGRPQRPGPARRTMSTDRGTNPNRRT
jgi:hypothetical protein